MNKDNSNIDYGAALDKIKANPFNPNMNEDQTGQMFGYSKCLQDLSNYLHVITEYKPEKRYIDTVPLIDGISKAFGELRKLIAKASEAYNEADGEQINHLDKQLNWSEEIPNYQSPLKPKP